MKQRDHFAKSIGSTLTRRLTRKLKGLVHLLLTAAFFVGLFAPAAFATSQPPGVVVPDSPFIEAVRDGDIDAIAGTLIRGQTPDVRDKSGSPALFVALQYNQPDMFRFLIEKGAKVRAKDRAGNTLLTVLANTRQLSIAELVLQSGADPDRYGANGEPPIIIAARAGQLEMIRLLLAHDVDFDATDLTGRSALSIARERRSQAIVDLLLEAGAS